MSSATKATDLPFTGLPRDVAAPNELKAIPQWVAWRYEDRGGSKPTKPPVNPHTGGYASCDSPATWGTYEQAERRAREDGLPGVGFVLSEDDNLTGYDFDGCRNPTSGKLKPWVQEILSHGETYAEISPSGTGIRLIARGKIAAVIKYDPAKVEVYGHGRYLTITGQRLDCAPDAIGPAPNTKASCRARVKLHNETWAALKKAGPKLFGKGANSERGEAKCEEAKTGKRKRGVLWEAVYGFTKEPFFRNANDAALQNLSAWVPTLFGAAAKQSNKGYRVSSAALGRDLEEDLSFTSQGIKDFGVHDMGDANEGKRSPIDVVLEYGGAETAADAALWLCERLGVDPASLGWRGGASQEAKPSDHDDDNLVTTAAADLEMCGVDWLWPGRFALGKIGLIAGLPDYGKGQIAAFIAAAVTAAIKLPCDEGSVRQGNVIWFNAEDDARDTVLPRLVAAGADPRRVHFVNCSRVGGKDRSFSLVTDLPLLRKRIMQIGSVVLVIIDPVSAYLGVGKVDTRSTTDVRGVLTPLKELAEELHLAVIGIAHFNKKVDVTSALLRISDSLAYVAAARHVYVVLDDPEDNTMRLFVKAKNNLAADKKALRYGIGVRTVGHDIEAPFIVWHPQHVEVTANEAMQAAVGQSGHTRREAREFLLNRLEAGPVKSDDILKEAKQEGIAERTLKRAKKELGIRSHKTPKKFDGDWTWELPAMKRKMAI